MTLKHFLYRNNELQATLLTELEPQKSKPKNIILQTGVIIAFNTPNFLQGAALTYAPYLNLFASDAPFDNSAD